MDEYDRILTIEHEDGRIDVLHLAPGDEVSIESISKTDKVKSSCYIEQQEYNDYTTSLYKIDYENENEFRKLERGLKKYHMAAYKEYYFTYRPKLQAGDFSDAVLNGDVYEIALKTDRIFKKVHGQCKLIFKVKDYKVILLDITPRKMLLEGHNPELCTYKGIFVSRDNIDKNIFKINLLNLCGHL